MQDGRRLTGPLANCRWERFAQELAKGRADDDAYRFAGYRPDRKNAHRLTTIDDVQRRVAELQERCAIRTELTVASITDRLIKIADEAQALGEASGLAVARAAMMDAAKLNGLIVDRRENVNITHDVSDVPMTEEEWAATHCALN